MAKVKFDGIVEAVHYDPEGTVKWVRAYLRRGPTFSDHMLIDRQALVDKIKSGQKFFAGRRIPLEASTFEVKAPLKLIQNNGQEILVVGENYAQQDHLESVPII